MKNEFTCTEKNIFTKGVGTHKDELHSFERALRDAGIEKCNLVQVSSIFPPGCKVISKTQGLREIIPGCITYCVLSRCCTNEPKRLLAASVGCAIPADKSSYGYISEHHAFGQMKNKRAIMRRTWRRRCWHPHWASILMWMKAGMRKKKFLKSAAKSCEPSTLPNPQFVRIRITQRSLLLQSLFFKFP